MIRISFRKDANGYPTAFSVEGHAGYAEAGKDIICAAVSMLTMNTVNSVEEFTDDPFVLDTNEKKGYIMFSFSQIPSNEAQLFLRSFELGINNLVIEYGKKYLRIIDWEV